MRVRPLLFVLVAAVAASSCGIAGFASGDRHREEFEYTRTLKEGGAVSVRTFNGRIEVAAWDGDTVEIAGEKRAHSLEALDELKIRVEDSARGLEIEAERPDRGWKNWGGAGASFQVRVPRGSHVELVKTSNGSVDVSGAAGDIEIETSNGSIHLEDHSGAADLDTSNGRIEARGIRGRLAAETSNGSIDADIASVSGSYPVRLDSSNGSIHLAVGEAQGGDIEIRTSNSSITLELPSSIGARIDAKTSNGSVKSEFEVTGPNARRTKNRLEGVIGDGSGSIEVHTSNGGIRIKRRG